MPERAFRHPKARHSGQVARLDFRITSLSFLAKPGEPCQSSALYRYSHRLSWSFSQNFLSQLTTEKKENGIPVLDLTVSNPTEVLAYPHAEIRAALSECETYLYRPDPFGSEEARANVSKLYREFGFDVPASRIALTASTSEAYSLLLKLLCDPDDEILVPVPSYPLFEYLAALENVHTVPYRLQYDGSWFIDFADLRARISPRSRAIVLVNPNNPTGSFLKKRERQALVELARERELPIISDEVFMSYEYGSGPERVKTMVDEESVLSFSLNGLSKMAAMPQMKLAWMVINGPTDERQTAKERMEMLLDTYLSVNTPVQLALPGLLEIGSKLRTDLLARVNENLNQAHRLLRNSPVHILHIEGGWSMLLQLPGTLSEENWILLLLNEKNVLLQPGFFFDMPSAAHAVASLIVEPDVFTEGVARLGELAKELTRG